VGLLTDYFRARDAAAAAVVDGPEWAGPLFPRGSAEPFDGVEAKRIEPWVVLPRLVGFVLGVPYSSDLVETIWIRPTEAELEATGDSPESAVVQLGDGVRDVLAGVTAEQVPELAARWATIEEFSWTSSGQGDADYLAEVLSGLAVLSRRAQAAGEHVYCWWSV
jgi:hypothetical protein